MLWSNINITSFSCRGVKQTSESHALLHLVCRVSWLHYGVSKDRVLMKKSHVLHKSTILGSFCFMCLFSLKDFVRQSDSRMVSDAKKIRPNT